MAFDINWNKSSANDISAQIERAKADLMKSSSTPATNSGTSVLRDAYDSRNNTSSSSSSKPWESYHPIGAATSVPSAVTQKATNNSATGLPSWMGNMYSQVPGTDYYSTNPSNRNSSKYYADGRAVPSIGFDYSQTGGQKFDGYGTPEQFKNIVNMSQSNDQSGISGYLQSLLSQGALTSNDSIYKNGLASDPRPSLTSVATASPTVKTATMTPTSGYTKNPTVDAMPLQQQLDYYKAHPDEARQEVLRTKTVYDQKSGAGDTAGANSAHSWADMIRQAAGINDSDTNYGNNNGVDAETQRKYLEALLAGRNNVDTGAGTGADGTGGTGDAGTGAGSGGAGTGNGTGQSQSAVDLIKSMYEANLASQSQQIKSSRDLMLAGLAGKEGVINQNTIQNLNSNDVVANQRMQALKEAMANQGLASSGDSITGQIGIGTSQQQGASDINNNKTNQLADLLAQRNAINNNASADDLALLQQLQGQRDGLLLNQSNADRTFNYNAGQDAIKNDRQTKVDNWNAYMDSVGLTGNLGTGAKADWSLLGGTDGAMTLDAKTKYLQQEGIKVNNELAKIQLADYPAEQKLKMLQLQKQIDQIGKAPYQSAVDVEYDKIKLDTAKEQLNQLVNGKLTKPQTAEDFTKDINAKPGVITKDYTGKEVVNKDSAEDAILLTPLSDYEKYRLYVQYGIKDRWPADQIPKAPGK